MRSRHLLLGSGLIVASLLVTRAVACPGTAPLGSAPAAATLAASARVPVSVQTAGPEAASTAPAEEARPDEAAAKKGADELERGAPVATPPGTVPIPAEPQVVVGLPVDDAEALIAAHPDRANSIVGETPQHRVRVDAFHLGACEVTNEQYRAFVLATGHRVPQHWGEAALAEARRVLVEQDGLRRKEALDAGKTPPAPTTFDPHGWWEQHWQEAEWEMPEALAATPVTWVDHGDAMAYARWAGMRLMTEAEYHAAGRGQDAKKRFPWGTEFEASRAAAAALGNSAVPVRVGAHAGGATEHGVHDLIGNAWEWTSTPYDRFPGYKELTVTIEERGNKRKVVARTTWDADERVVVGGSVQNPGEELRLSMRRGAVRSQRTNALGFRVAATPRPGVDRASYIATARAFGKEKPAMVRMLAIDRWYATPGTATLSKPAGSGASDASEPAAGDNLYGVVTGYEHLLALPPEKLPFLSLNTLSTATLTDGPVTFAVISTALPLVEPALPPGDYAVAYRGPGKSRQREDEDAQEPVDQLQDGEPGAEVAVKFDRTVANYLFSTLDGKLVAAMHAPSHPTFDKPDRDASNGKLAIVRDDKGKKGDLVALTVVVPGSASQTNAFHFELPLRVAPGALAGAWRR